MFDFREGLHAALCSPEPQVWNFKGLEMTHLGAGEVQMKTKFMPTLELASKMKVWYAPGNEKPSPLEYEVIAPEEEWWPPTGKNSMAGYSTAVDGQVLAVSPWNPKCARQGCRVIPELVCKCRLARCCGELCQREDWKEHWKTCWWARGQPNAEGQQVVMRAEAKAGGTGRGMLGQIQRHICDVLKLAALKSLARNVLLLRCWRHGASVEQMPDSLGKMQAVEDAKQSNKIWALLRREVTLAMQETNPNNNASGSMRMIVLDDMDARTSRLVRGAEELIMSRVVVFLLEMKVKENPYKRKACAIEVPQTSADAEAAEQEHNSAHRLPQ